MSFKEVAQLEGHSEEVWHLSWSPKGGLLASSGTDKTVRLWQKEGDRWVMKSTLSDGHTRTVRASCFSPCGNFMASTSFDATIVIWQRKESEFEIIATLEGHENEVKRAAWSPSGQYLATCSRDKSVWVWEMDEDDDFTCCSILQVHSQDVKHVTWHPKCDILVSCSYDDSVKFFKYDGDDWTEFQSLNNAHNSTVWGASFNAEGTRLVTCGQDATLKIWASFPPGAPPESGKWSHVATIADDIHNGPIFYVDWCPLTDCIATACLDNGIRIFKEKIIEGGTPVYELIHHEADAHSQDVNCVRWSSSEPGLLASCGDDALIKLWKLDENLALVS